MNSHIDRLHEAADAEDIGARAAELSYTALLDHFRAFNELGARVSNSSARLASNYYESAEAFGNELAKRAEQRSSHRVQSAHTGSKLGKLANRFLGIVRPS